MQIRIRGLIKFLHRIQDRLQQGFPPSRVDDYREQIRRVVRDVERICHEHGGTPEHLPTPSRNAYYFLKNLDLQNLPVAAQSATPAALPGTIGVKNVVRITGYYTAHLWEHATGLLAERGQREALRREMQDHIAAMEEICASQNATPARLTRPAQQLYCWLKFLSDDENLSTHLRTLVTGQKLVRQIVPEQPPLPFEIHLQNMRFVYRVKNYSDAVVLKCSEGLIAADEPVWREILETVLRGKKRRGRSAALDEFLESEDFSGVLFEMASAIEPDEEQLQGQVHDLGASFERVNRRYFGGSMPRPHIHWNRIMTMGKMGHYHYARDTIMISRTLDQPDVPPFVVDFVMYHELLHKKHGLRRINGRRYAHTPEFRTDERGFVQYDLAVEYLNQLALRQRGHAVSLPQIPAGAEGREPSRKKSGWVKKKRKAKRRKKKRR